MRNSFVVRACVCMALSFGLFATSTAQAQTIKNADNTLSEASKLMDYLETNYLKKEWLNVEFDLERRYNDARVAYEIKEYDKAAPMFLDVVSRGGSQFGSYRAALFYLGDSLFYTRNFVGAQRYFRRLIKLGPGDFFQESLRQLLEVAYRTKNYDGVDEIYKMLDKQSSSNLSSSVNYLRGKTLYAQKRYTEARTYLDKAAATDKRLAPQAKYFAAVTLVAEKKLDEAIKRFIPLTKGAVKTPEEQRVRNLSWLSMGRIKFEQGKYGEALDYYNRVPQSDPAFTKAGYEATWTLVQLKEYREAQENVDLLILADTNPETYTKAVLLRADISLRIKDYDVALESFQDILKRYDPVKKQIEAFSAKHGNLYEFFQGLVKEDLTLTTPEGLPYIRTDFVDQSPEEWLSRGPLMKKTKAMIGDVATMRSDIQSSIETLDEIEARLGSSTRVQAFPKIAEGMGRGLELESTLLLLRRALLRRELELLRSSLTGGDSTKLQGLEAELAVLDKQFKAAPKTIDDLNARQEKVEADFKKLRDRANELGYTIDGLKAEMTAIDTYIQTQKVPLSQEEKKKVDKLREEIRINLKALEAERQKLLKEIAVSRQKVNVGSVMSDDERSSRALYRKKMAQISSVLAPYQRNTSDADMPKIVRIRGQLNPIETRLTGFFNQMYQIVDRKLVIIKKQVVSERSLLKDHLKSLDLVTGSSRKIAGELAYRNFVAKKKEFDNSILRADVGTIDVLYQKKEDTTQDINKLFQQRTQELRALQESFEELR